MVPKNKPIVLKMFFSFLLLKVLINSQKPFINLFPKETILSMNQRQRDTYNSFRKVVPYEKHIFPIFSLNIGYRTEQIVVLHGGENYEEGFSKNFEIPVMVLVH